MAIHRIVVWDAVDEFLLSKPSEDEIIAFQAPETLQNRAAELLERNREGDLTVEEQAELDEITAVEKFVMRLKAKALAKRSA
jgi:hypothetical protein